MKSADGSISASMMSWMVAVGRKPASDAVCCEQAPSPSSSAKGKKIFVCIAGHFLAGPRHIRTGGGNPYTKHSSQGKQSRREGPPPELCDERWHGKHRRIWYGEHEFGRSAWVSGAR